MLVAPAGHSSNRRATDRAAGRRGGGIGRNLRPAIRRSDTAATARKFTAPMIEPPELHGKTQSVRPALRNAPSGMETGTAFDVFGSELPGETFTGVFEQPRHGGWRDVDL
jgi:hypothetical protein